MNRYKKPGVNWKWSAATFVCLSALFIIAFSVPTHKSNRAEMNKIQLVSWERNEKPIEFGDIEENLGPCAENSFVFDDPPADQIRALANKIADHPSNGHLKSERLPLNAKVFVEDGTSSKTWTVGEEDYGFLAIARAHLREKIRRDLVFQCLGQIVNKR